jgi:opacity protein-like surface antigen
MTAAGRSHATSSQGPDTGFCKRGNFARHSEDATPMSSHLKTSAVFFALGLGASATLSTGALAGDMYNGSPGRLKDYGQAAVPVPAPNPYTEVYQYYLRGDLGLRVGGFSSYSESGMTYGANETLSPFGSDRFASHANGSAMIPGTLGAGVYLTPRFRADATVDFRQKTGGEIAGSYGYVADRDMGLQPGGGGVATGSTTTGLVVGTAPSTAANSSTVSGMMRDAINTQSTVMMVNGYYDLTERGRFTPYIGAGVGVSYNRLERDYSSTETIQDPTPVAGAAPAPWQRSFTSKGSEAHLTLAAAAMAGATVKIDQRTTLDLNYRLQYIQGYNVVSNVAPPSAVSASGAQTTYGSRMSVGDLWEHQLRAGVRVNLW